MAKVALVTDSTANIPLELTGSFPLHVAPLQVIWGKEIYRDGIDIQPAEFYTRLKDAKEMPTTSQATPASFNQIYHDLLEQGYDILSIHISSKLSGTLDSAYQSRQNFPGAKIELVDSNTTSMAMGFPLLVTMRAAAQGASLFECKALIEKACAQTGVYFAVSTLEFLRRGGRIGGAAAFLGTALNLKPILELRDGHIEAIERVRTMGKTIDRLLNLFEEKVGAHRPVYIAALHANAPDEAAILLDRAQQRFDRSDIAIATLADISPVLGTHTGPGCMGLAFMTGM